MESDSNHDTEQLSFLNLEKENVAKIPSLDKFVAVDCEMVGVGEAGVSR